jgi:hypothetical protein
MIATTPLTINGQTFDRYSLNLAITGKYKAGGSPDASIAMRLIPTRIADGNVITADEQAASIVLGSLEQADEPTMQAVAAVQAALQTFLTAKGL